MVAHVGLLSCGKGHPHLPKLAASLADCWASLSLDLYNNAVCIGSISRRTVRHAAATLHALWHCLHIVCSFMLAAMRAAIIRSLL